MSVIAGLLRNLFGKEEHRGLMLGLDASGRTTFLYRLILDEVVTTIPTIGFNVESVKSHGVSFTLWDVGGCDKIRPLWRHYYQNTSILMYFVDSNDKERLEETLEEYRRILTEPDVVNNLRCIGIIATKQDLPGAMSIDHIAYEFGVASTKLCPCKVFPISLKDTRETYFNVLNWMADSISSNPAPAPKPAEPSKPQEDDLLTRWLAVEDEPDDEFLKKLVDYTLESWDHRAHLRIAWLYLLRNGRRDGMKLIFDGIKNYIEYSLRANKTKFHETLTYFWVHMVHYAMVATKNPKNDFKTFLLLNPQLSNGGLFLEYYTKEHIMSPEARAAVVLPDKKPLPSLITDTKRKAQPLARPVDPSADAAVSSSSSLDVKSAYDESVDAEFIKAFEQRQLRKWSHEYFVRVIFVYLRQQGRKEGMNKVFNEMKAMMKGGFHYTRTYFWCHMVDYALASEVAAAPADFAALLKRHPELLDEKLPFKYFPADKIDSDVAVKEMIPPTKALPSLLSK